MDICFVYDRENTELSSVFDLVKRHSGDASIVTEGGDTAVTIAIDTALPAESYRIERNDKTHFSVFGGDRLGLLYGIGRLLHRGVSLAENETCVPQKKIRGAYFATHFYNYYQAAPLDAITEYLEELVLWGCNSIAMWFDMHHFSGMTDPKAEELISRIHDIAAQAKKIGLKVLLGMLANEYYAGAPKELLSENSTDGTGYHKPLCGFYYTELCPSKPKAKALLIRSHNEILDRFTDIGLDYVWLWPYDQGGCTCKDCRPWGANGFVDLSCDLAKAIKERFPHAECALSTWRFDAFTTGEWQAFTERIDEVANTFDYIVADFPSGTIPNEFYKKAEERGLPLFGFPEISMLSATPWGGFGAVPVPDRLYRQYNETKDRHDGGFMYSEGIFEDINKVIMLGLYMGNGTPDTILSDYFRFYFSEASCEAAAEWIACLESTLSRNRINADGRVDDYPREDYVEKLPTFRLNFPQKVQRAYELANEVNDRIPQKNRESVRFRMLYLRSVMDKALFESGGTVTEQTEAAAKELEKLFYAERADYAVCPITEKAIHENRGHI